MTDNPSIPVNPREVVAGVEEPIAAEAGVRRIPEAGATIATEAEEDPHTEEARDNDVSVQMKSTQT